MTLSRREWLAGASGLAVAVFTGASAVAAPTAKPTKGPKPKPTETQTPTPTPSPSSTECELPRTYNATICPPSSSTALFQDDFSAGNFNKWGQLQWSTSGVVRNGNGNLYSGTGEYSGQIVSESAEHPTAARFELRDGDIPFGGTERTEMAEPGPDQANLYPGEGTELTVEFDAKFDAAFPVPHASSGWCIFMQWHDTDIGGSPPLCLDIDSDDVIYLANNDASGYQRTAVMSVQRGAWQHWEIRSKFSSNAATGFAEVTVDGVVKVAQQSRKTMIPGDSANYFKMGIYRDPVNTATAILYFDNVVITAP